MEEEEEEEEPEGPPDSPPQPRRVATLPLPAATAAVSAFQPPPRVLDKAALAPPTSGGAGGGARAPPPALPAVDAAAVNGAGPTEWDAKWDGVRSEWSAPGGAGGGAARTPQEEAASAARLAATEAALASLGDEQAVLRGAARSAARDAAQVTSAQLEEVRHLLTLCGVPFVVAPAEAEAQCAFLEQAGLVDAVVTDDCDAFLFGAQTVCRKMFDPKAFGELYTAAAIRDTLGLDREGLARLALLLGSDYTRGVPGVGVVNAAEIAAAFPGMDGLRRFKEWTEAPDSDLVAAAHRKATATAAKRAKRKAAPKPRAKRRAPASADASDEDEAVSSDEAGDAEPEAEPAAAADASAEAEAEAAAAEEEDPREAAFKRAHSSHRKAWSPGDGFPSSRVVEAYLRPTVDASREGFTWGRPDEGMLRAFCRTHLAWQGDATELVLKDMLAQHDVRDSQRTVTAFFRTGERVAKVRSKRLRAAVAKLAGAENPELALAMGEEDTTRRKARKKPQPKRSKKVADMPAAS